MENAGFRSCVNTDYSEREEHCCFFLCPEHLLDVTKVLKK